jgi:hypothetical protein
MARAFTAASSQYISVASAAPLNFGTGEFTVAFWCRFPVAPPSNSVMVHKRTGGFDGGTGWEFVVTNGGTGAVRWDVQGGAVQLRATATIGTLFDGAWHHIALDHVDSNPDMIRIWFDGTMVGSTSGNLTQTVSTATPMAIGAAYNTRARALQASINRCRAGPARRPFRPDDPASVAVGLFPTDRPSLAGD